MNAATPVAAHYSSGTLMERLRAALTEDGVDPDHPSLEALAPYDQFHGRGLEATEEIATALALGPHDRVLDVGSGLGGPARYLASRTGCQVVGIDLTAEFCAVATALTAQLGLADRVTFRQGDALALAFEAVSFDALYSMNVSMNIADRDALYAGFHRVLRPGGRLVLSEIAQGPGGEVAYPTPWARTAQTSFLLSPQATRAGLEAAGFEVLSVTDRSAESLAYRATARETVASGGKHPHRSIELVHGDLAATIMATGPRSIEEGRTVPIEVLCRKPT